MGRGIIQHPETKKYAIWSSVVDDFITDWLSEEELKQWEINDYAEQIKEQPIKISRFKTYEECLSTIETYHGKERVDEVKDGGSNNETCAFSNENEIEEAYQYYMKKNFGHESDIVYKPHCRICGALIDEEVSFKKIIMESNQFSPFAYETAEVYPNVCKECGAIFKCIEIKEPKLLSTEEIK